MVSPHVQQLFWVKWINAIKHHSSLVEALKRVSLGAHSPGAFILLFLL